MRRGGYLSLRQSAERDGGTRHGRCPPTPAQFASHFCPHRHNLALWTCYQQAA